MVAVHSAINTMIGPEINVNVDSYDESEESLNDIYPDDEDRSYFPIEESKPPHY